MKTAYMFIDSFSPDIELYENPLDVYFDMVEALRYYHIHLKRFGTDDFVAAVNELADSYATMEETDFFGCSVGDLSLSCYKKEIH